ncbi:glycosyl transferase [Haloarcula taiwanensis]|uniref:Glycosyl transferase n=1 Tax=Haloarcula taiwanensis TaxID=1932004 RepID=A0A2H4ZY43_9EURY|nr:MULTISPECIES: glycosyltransferase [Haloarcula]AUG47401.1 glycosyl transferase [Haloarcula taiwanensis]RLM33929.1 glycosyltransferase [Haloarcula sp. Atlit-120R]RLM42498.1 glycosyltransferase [Haloarcula sp. Atlit-47R]
MDAAVIVPAYNEAESLARCLAPFESQPVELVVVVGGDDGTEQVARDAPFVDTVVRCDEGGAGIARNRGAEAATAPILLFTDADTVVPEDWVRLHLRHYTDDDVVGVGGPARPLEDSLKHRVLFKLLSDYWYRVSWPLGFVQQPGFNCSFRADAFEAAGGFDEDIPFMEDTELSLRMKDYGRIVYDADSCVATSARREADEGYLSLFAKYVRGYANHYILRREFDADYF